MVRDLYFARQRSTSIVAGDCSESGSIFSRGCPMWITRSNPYPLGMLHRGHRCNCNVSEICAATQVFGGGLVRPNRRRNRPGFCGSGNAAVISAVFIAAAEA